ncbi:Ldh family oxidoreductase [Salirhabdus salicampi]|uniref:Ldh family oxidoreductase n=1 Tax=Salirhabdus salicampi TaxID=476102 RepID=UPI003461E3DB
MYKKAIILVELHILPKLQLNKIKIGIVFTNRSPIIAPTGSNKRLIGNNPWSVSVPTTENPITLDQANTI